MAYKVNSFLGKWSNPKHKNEFSVSRAGTAEQTCPPVFYTCEWNEEDETYTAEFYVPDEELPQGAAVTLEPQTHTLPCGETENITVSVTITLPTPTPTPTPSPTPTPTPTPSPTPQTFTAERTVFVDCQCKVVEHFSKTESVQLSYDCFHRPGIPCEAGYVDFTVNNPCISFDPPGIDFTGRVDEQIPVTGTYPNGSTFTFDVVSRPCPTPTPTPSPTPTPGGGVEIILPPGPWYDTDDGGFIWEGAPPPDIDGDGVDDDCSGEFKLLNHSWVCKSSEVEGMWLAQLAMRWVMPGNSRYEIKATPAAVYGRCGFPETVTFTIEGKIDRCNTGTFETVHYEFTDTIQCDCPSIEPERKECTCCECPVYARHIENLDELCDVKTAFKSGRWELVAYTKEEKLTIAFGTINNDGTLDGCDTVGTQSIRLHTYSFIDEDNCAKTYQFSASFHFPQSENTIEVSPSEITILCGDDFDIDVTVDVTSKHPPYSYILILKPPC